MKYATSKSRSLFFFTKPQTRVSCVGTTAMKSPKTRRRAAYHRLFAGQYPTLHTIPARLLHRNPAPLVCRLRDRISRRIALFKIPKPACNLHPNGRAGIFGNGVILYGKRNGIFRILAPFRSLRTNRRLHVFLIGRGHHADGVFFKASAHASRR